MACGTTWFWCGITSFMTIYGKTSTNYGPVWPFIYVVFSTKKAHNMLAIMLNPCFKGLGLFTQYVQKGKKLHIVSVYDRHINLLLFLVHAYQIVQLKKLWVIH